MNFIVDLSQSKEHNVIFVVVNRLIKKRYYISCTITDEDISVEYTAKMLVNHIFRLHELPSLIVSNRDPQFVITVWKSFCTRLDIITKLFIAFHSQTDDQTKRSNQDLERYLRTYCNYMQDDWAKWIFMTEFADNDEVSSFIEVISFYVNKEFYSRISFSKDFTIYAITRKYLDVVKVEDIANNI